MRTDIVKFYAQFVLDPSFMQYQPEEGAESPSARWEKMLEQLFESGVNDIGVCLSDTDGVYESVWLGGQITDLGRISAIFRHLAEKHGLPFHPGPSGFTIIKPAQQMS